ncbi:hypothetical protein J2W96_004192 [Variovorax guangxiensis]|nr:hypothetical protein [Variovorax guangxiensis]
MIPRTAAAALAHLLPSSILPWCHRAASSARAAFDLAPQPLGLGLDLRRLRPVGRLQGVEVALDALLELPLTRVDLASGEVAVAAVDG